jgi:hypothetical protein
MDLDSFLVSLYVLLEHWWKLNHPWRPPKTGRPALLSAIRKSSPWPSSPSGPACAARGTSGASLGRTCAPTSLCFVLPGSAQSAHPSPGAPDARVAAHLRPRARLSLGRLWRDGHHPRPGHSEGEGFSQGALLLRSGYFREERLQDLRWVYGFKVALVVDPDGVISAFGLAPMGLRGEARRGGP